MSVASHLQFSPSDYDRKIRGLIPLYDDLIPEVARALGLASRRVRRIVDLGIGTGALTAACLAATRGAQVWGIDADPTMMAMARTRLGRRASRVTLVEGNFLDARLPPCDAIVASYALHHIRTRRQKQAFYRRCHAAIRLGGGGAQMSWRTSSGRPDCRDETEPPDGDANQGRPSRVLVPRCSTGGPAEG